MCKHCQMVNCGVLNPDQCPFTILWERENEKQEILEEAVRILEG